MSANETTYVKKFDDNKIRERVAYTEADHVQLKFDGWTPKAAETKTSSAHAGDTKTGK